MDRTVKEVDAISFLVALIVSLGMYLGLFFKKNWVFKRTHCGHMQLEFIDYILVSYVLNILNTEMRKEKNVHNPSPQGMNRVGNGRLVNKLIGIRCDKCYYRYIQYSEVETRLFHVELLGSDSERDGNH